MNASTSGDADVAHVAALIGDRSRARVLMTLSDGRALPASVLASEAGVAASTISEHLAQLCEANLLTAERQGRARHFRLADPSVAEALEAIARIAPPEPIRSLRQGTRAHTLRRARTCYNHLAGRLGVALMSSLIDLKFLTGADGQHHPDRAPSDRLSGPGVDCEYALTAAGRHSFESLGVDLATVDRHRPAIRYCLDWSEQRHHLAGPLGTALTTRMFELDWIRRYEAGRAVRLTPVGADALEAAFGLTSDWDDTLADSSAR